MVGPTSPRTAMLFRVYYSLLAVSVVLSGALIANPVATPRNAPREIAKPASRDAKVPRQANLFGHPNPGINWGGQKR